MKILKVKIENFRGYNAETQINLSDLSVFVGKNDIGEIGDKYNLILFNVFL